MDTPYRRDYRGIHEPVYRRIAAGERSGWSDDVQAAHALAQVQRALALAPPSAPARGCLPARLLELGCGDGCLTVRLARALSYAVSGIDIVPLAIELAQRRAAGAGVTLDLQCGSVLALPWPDASCAVVVDGCLLHCIVLGDRARCLGEARRVLAPGGVLVVMSMVGDPPPSAQFTFDPLTRCHIQNGVAGRYFATPQGLADELAAAGLAPVTQWLNPATSASECDELVIAARAVC